MAVAALAIASAASAVERASGGGGSDRAQIRGAVFVGPLCGGEPGGGTRRPRCRINFRPIRARIRFVRQDESAPARSVQSGADGRFSIELPAGTYELQPLAARNTTGAGDPRRLTFTAGQVDDVIIDYDQGLR
jgi:hypothetical protein